MQRSIHHHRYARPSPTTLVGGKTGVACATTPSRITTTKNHSPTTSLVHSSRLRHCHTISSHTTALHHIPVRSHATAPTKGNHDETLSEVLDEEFLKLQNDSHLTYSNSLTIRSHLHVQSQMRALYPKEIYDEVETNLTTYKQYTPKLSKTPGLFGTCGVNGPSSLYLLIRDKTELIKSRAHHLLTNPTSSNSLQYLDDMSKLLCDIADIIEAIRNTHGDSEMRETAQGLSLETQKILGEWSSSPIVLLTLYNIMRTKTIWDQLTVEGRRIVLDLLGRMSFNAKYNTIAMICLHLRSESEFNFSQGSEDPPKWTPLNITLSQLTKHDQQLVEQYPHILSVNRRGVVSFRNDPYYANVLLKSATTPDLRRLIYNIKDAVVYNHLYDLEDVIRYRHLSALAKGSVSHAHDTATSLLSKTPDVPIKFLSSFSDSIKKARLNEYKLMKAVLNQFESASNDTPKQAHNGNTAGDAKSALTSVSDSIIGYFKDKSTFIRDPDALYPWDIPFAKALIEATSNKKMEQVQDYFRLDYVLQGFGLICNVMNVTTEIHKIRDGEGWTGATRVGGEDLKRVYNHYKGNDDINNSTYHYAVHTLREEGTWCSLEDIDKYPSLLQSPIIKFHLSDKTTNTLLGVLYLDLYQGAGKFDGDCQFVISCGRVTHDKIADPSLTYDEILKEHQLQSTNSGEGEKTPSMNTVLHKYDLPVSLLNTHIQDRGELKFSRGSAKDDQAYREGPPIRGSGLPRLKYQEVQTIFHELGHSLHTILSRSQFQHFAGSRCEMDFVELPSTLLETLVDDPSFLRLFARHYETGQPLPDDLCEAIHTHTNLFPAYETTQTVVSGLLDLRLHTPPAPYDPMLIFPSLSSQYDPSSPAAITSALDSFENEDSIRKYTHAHASPQQTTHITHSIYRRYADIDISEDGFGVYLNGGYTLSSPYNVPKTSQVVPQASDTHLAHYGGFYFSYTYCKAFAMLVKHLMLEELLSPTPRKRRAGVSARGGVGGNLLSTASPSTQTPSSVDSKDLSANASRIDQRQAYQHYHERKVKHHLDTVTSRLGHINGVDANDASLDTIQAIPVDAIRTTPGSSDNHNDDDDEMTPTSPPKTLADTRKFDHILPTTTTGTLFRKLVLEKGGTENGLEILADMLNLPGPRQTLEFPSHLFDEYGELTPQYLTQEQREKRESLTRKRDARRKSNIRSENVTRDPVNVDQNYPKPPVYPKDMKIVSQSISLALNEVGWTRKQLSERQEAVLRHAFDTLTETVNKQSQLGIRHVTTKLGITLDDMHDISSDNQSYLH